MPVEVAGEVLGVLTFGVLSGPRSWPTGRVDRLQLLAHVFGSALRRRDAERQLRSALVEVETLKRKLIAESRYLEQEIATEGRFEEIVGSSGPIRNVLYQVEQVAPTKATILILGETGTGKELVARILHRKSDRADRPMVKVNCAALPATLIESELFGHERGAFTGAVKAKIGRFELADGGTIFLDEIGDLPLDLQVKLLRVLQDGEFERLGSNETRSVDVRVIAATNRDLIEAIKDG
ncbi:MAG: sigma-54-dependent Fis family transcriptional regulator, partial [Acidobacteria bacterium]|nr:sigma-54-dependent Fis family transcriptional regulator [Acidobacteriota bacterium]